MPRMDSQDGLWIGMTNGYLFNRKRDLDLSPEGHYHRCMMDTAGVYHLPTKVDRSVMGAEKLKPTLFEGKAAPELFPVMENGVTYLVNLGDSFSTGIFLDQRLQRAWLADVCNEDTRVLNCFAHTGAFSVAAATAGATAVSMDLDKKWLDRIRPQMEANGIMEWDGVHDCIYGDCK